MKDQALWIYQRLTQVQRSQRLSQLKTDGNVPVAILFYHRIADRYPNEWTMSCGDFKAQLDWLEENFDVVSLAEAQQRVRAQENTRRTVCITFDDGYSDNANYAIPELVRRGLPATYFVSTDFVRTGKPFPHDVSAGQPLQPNSIDELRRFKSQGIDIGAHTRSHCDLGTIDDETSARREITESKQEIEEWLGTSVDYFAFPYGLPHNTSQLAVDIITESGFSGFCTAYGAWNWPDSAGFHLRRIHADPGLQRLKNWLTLDARKLQDPVTLPFIEPDQQSAVWSAQAGLFNVPVISE